MFETAEAIEQLSIVPEEIPVHRMQLSEWEALAQLISSATKRESLVPACVSCPTEDLPPLGEGQIYTTSYCLVHQVDEQVKLLKFQAQRVADLCL